MKLTCEQIVALTAEAVWNEEVTRTVASGQSVTTGKLILDELEIQEVSRCHQGNGYGAIKQISLIEQASTLAKGNFQVVIGRKTFGSLVAGDSFALGSNTISDIVRVVSFTSWQDLFSGYAQAIAEVDIRYRTVDSRSLFVCVVGTATYSLDTGAKLEFNIHGVKS